MLGVFWGDLMATMKRWARGAAAAPMAPSGRLAYVDAHVATLERVRRELAAARAELTQAEARWAALFLRGDDPASDAQRLTLGPEILGLRARVTALEAEATKEAETVAATVAMAEQYAALVTETAAWLQPVLAAVPADAVQQRAYATSRRLDRFASDLLTRTGDRRFRRPVVDPYSALREALTESLRVLEKQRFVSQHMPDKKKTG